MTARGMLGGMHATAITVVHKYIRRELFEVSRRLAVAGTGDVARVHAALDQVTKLLHGHDAHEAAMYERALSDAAPDLAVRMSHDHRRLDALLDALNVDARRAGLTAGDLARLNLDWNRFVAAYLTHLDDEERTYFPAIADVAPPVAEVARTAAAMPQDMQRAFLTKLWAVVTPDERAAIEHGLAGTQQSGHA
jgi:hypothetical protein